VHIRDELRERCAIDVPSTMASVMPVRSVMAGSIGADGCWNAWKMSMTDVIRSSA